MGGNELRYGSLFSGIGGIDLGMDMAGFECAWQVEIDDYCRQILDKHWPRVPKYKDIYEVKGKEIEPVDILCGGFPCQPVSVAGKRGGVNDERWLWDEFYRLICEIRPRWVVAENVTGLFSANSGRAFAGVLRNLAESGYDAVWDVYPAGGPGGVGAPHRRERVFLVAHTDRSKQAKKSGDVREVSGVSEVNRQDISTVVSGGSSEDVANTDKKRLQRSKETRDVEGKGQDGQKYIARCNKGAEQWAVEPNVGRVANGVPNRVDRLKTLGNAVVPQVAYKVARMIYEYTEKEK
ncbi:MAG: DNA cytosine methyltransferase [Candidatus Poseidoniales archaeon]